MKRISYSVATFINGLLSIISGCIAMMCQAFAQVNGFRRAYDYLYDLAVNEMNDATERLKILVVAGVALIVVSIIFKFIRHNEEISVLNTLLFVPLAVIVMFSVINYIPVIRYYTTYV